jgi:hypothetical protein
MIERRTLVKNQTLDATNSAMPTVAMKPPSCANPGSEKNSATCNAKSGTPVSITQGKQSIGALPSGGYGGIDKGDGTGCGGVDKRR